jgi:hypothetical protein
MRRLIGVALIAMLGAGVAGQAAVQKVETPDYSFQYAYPDAVARFPALHAWLDSDRARLRASIARQAAMARRESKGGAFPFRQYESQKTWKLVTETPRFLSLSGDLYAYTGGAHGNPASAALLWDKTAGRRIAPAAIFLSPAAIERAIAPAYCSRLNRERAKRRGEAVGKGGLFDDCPKAKELTILLGSSNRQRIDRIGLIADPYVAGAYAEGAYEVTLPVTPALLQAVKPAYRSAFALGR